MKQSFAVLIPVGPGSQEVARVRRVVSSVLQFESLVEWIVLVDNGLPGRFFDDRFPSLPGCRLVVLRAAFASAEAGHLGGLFANIMDGLQWIEANTCADFVLKLDTDSLIIRSFSELLYHELNSHNNIGQIGTIGRTCNRHDSTFGFEKTYVSPLIRMGWHWKQSSDATTSCLSDILTQAMANGYYTMHYCQGGAYAISARMLDLLRAGRHFQSAAFWTHVPVGEDVIMSMYTYALGLHLLDRSAPNQTFGLHWRGLPFIPGDLRMYNYAIVHSLKGNIGQSEDQLARKLGASLDAQYGG